MKKHFSAIAPLIALSIAILLSACSALENTDSQNLTSNNEVIEAKRQIEVKQQFNRISSGGYTLNIINNDGTVKSGTLNSTYEQGSDGDYNWNYSMSFKQIDDWDNIVDIQQAGDYVYGLSKNGNVFVTHPYEGNIEALTDVVAFTIGCSRTVIGLSKDGTVKVSGAILSSFDYGQNDVEHWTDIVALDSSSYHTVGLKADGTVLAAGLNEQGQCDVSAWTDIVEIHCGGFCTVGLKKDGSVLITGQDEALAAKLANMHDVQSVQVLSISATEAIVICLKVDGTISVERGENTSYGQNMQAIVSNWNGIEKIVCDVFPVGEISFEDILYGIKSDGSVLWTTDNDYKNESIEHILQTAGGITFD